MSVQNPATKLSQHERENEGLRWVPIRRAVDDAHINWNRIRNKSLIKNPDTNQSIQGGDHNGTENKKDSA